MKEETVKTDKVYECLVSPSVELDDTTCQILELLFSCVQQTVKGPFGAWQVFHLLVLRSPCRIRYRTEENICRVRQLDQSSATSANEGITWLNNLRLSIVRR